MSNYIGLDIGSTSTKAVIIDDDINILDSIYIETAGKPIESIKNCMTKLNKSYKIDGIATTGSGRNLAKVMLNADLAIDEITTHAVGVLNLVPEARTIIEIGGQDSKLIVIEDSIVTHFAMNTLCSAGCGAFLNHQANRLKIDINKFGGLALKSKIKCSIASKCTVFAETSVINKQSLGYKKEDILNGLCHSLVRNYLSILVKNEILYPKIVFCGGVSENIGVKKAFEDVLKQEIIIPKYNKIMGAVGAAILLKEQNIKSKFEFKILNANFTTKTFECTCCPNNCEIAQILKNKKVIAHFGSRCGRWV